MHWKKTTNNNKPVNAEFNKYTTNLFLFNENLKIPHSWHFKFKTLNSGLILEKSKRNFLYYRTSR